jgi:hypothetical protein
VYRRVNGLAEILGNAGYGRQCMTPNVQFIYPSHFHEVRMVHLFGIIHLT